MDQRSLRRRELQGRSEEALRVELVDAIENSEGFAAGRRVRLQGLRAATDDNGRSGVLETWNADTEGWRVQLDHPDKTVNAKVANIVLEPTAIRNLRCFAVDAAYDETVRTKRVVMHARLEQISMACKRLPPCVCEAVGEPEVRLNGAGGCGRAGRHGCAASGAALATPTPALPYSV